MYSLTSTISQTPSSLIPPISKPKSPFRFSFPTAKPITLTPSKPMENNQRTTAIGSTSTDSSSSPDHLLARREVLALGAAAVIGPPAAIGAVGEYPIKLDGVVTRVVARPRRSRSKKEKDEEEEVLVIEGIEFDRGQPVKFDVYVNDDDVGDSPRGGPDTAEFAGSMVNVPHGQRRGKSNIMKTCLRLGITDLLENVGADDDDSIIVTLVPKAGIGLVTIRNIGIELLA